jgi:hypothetical protein
MPQARTTSLLDDESLAEIGSRDESSGGDVCEACGCTRERHVEDGCACSKCDGFYEG